jgi:hypothetical protein
MNAFWTFFWPLVGFGMVAGVIAGLIGFRQWPRMLLVDYLRRRTRVPLAGAALCLIAAALWTGPLGGADRFIANIDREVRASLIHNEMTAVHVQLHRHPLTRQLALAGPADDFQRGALAQALSALPGVEGASWDGGAGGRPIVLEAAIAALLGFAIGLVPAYGVELRRRYNAEWSW